MTKTLTTLTAAALFLAFAASAAPAPAQSLSTPASSCAVPSIAARPLTNDPPLNPIPLPASYPAALQPALVQVSLSADGVPQKATIAQSTGDFMFDRAAIATVLAQRFAPEIRDCQAVAGTYFYQVDYSL